MKVEVNENVFPPRKHFVNVEEKFTNFTDRCRVLPATYFEEPNTLFFLKAKYLPGEKKTFPNGGFEVYTSENAIHNFELDQCVVHPFQFGMTKYFSKVENTVKEKVTTGVKGKRGRPRINPDELKTFAAYVPKGTKRGRQPLSDEARAERDAKLAEKKAMSSGRRGRPKRQEA